MGRRWWARVRQWWATERHVYTLRGWVPWWQVRRGDVGEVGVTLGAVSMGDRESSTPRRSEFWGMNSADGRDCYPDDGLHRDGPGGLWRGTSADPYDSPDEVGRRRR